jgi:hypothetical protein
LAPFIIYSYPLELLDIAIIKASLNYYLKLLELSWVDIYSRTWSSVLKSLGLIGHHMVMKNESSPPF